MSKRAGWMYAHCSLAKGNKTPNKTQLLFVYSNLFEFNFSSSVIYLYEASYDSQTLMYNVFNI